MLISQFSFRCRHVYRVRAVDPLSSKKFPPHYTKRGPLPGPRFSLWFLVYAAFIINNRAAASRIHRDPFSVYIYTSDNLDNRRTCQMVLALIPNSHHTGDKLIPPTFFFDRRHILEPYIYVPLSPFYFGIRIILIYLRCYLFVQQINLVFRIFQGWSG